MNGPFVLGWRGGIGDGKDGEEQGTHSVETWDNGGKYDEVTRLEGGKIPLCIKCPGLRVGATNKIIYPRDMFTGYIYIYIYITCIV